MPVDGLYNTTPVKAKYSRNISESRKIISLNLHYNASNGFFFANSLKINQFKAKGSEIKLYPLCLLNISDFAVANLKKMGLRDTCIMFLLIITLLISLIL